MNTEGQILTIFTPTYNRAYTLPRLYASLREQTVGGFVWLVVDDGSTDGTRELVAGWMGEENPFEIRYEYQENGGTHTAYNTAYRIAETELIVCIDSDDRMPENAVELIVQKWNEVRDCGVQGIVGLDAYAAGQIIGKRDVSGLQTATMNEYFGSSFRRWEVKVVYRTEYMRALPPFPVFENEKYFGVTDKGALFDPSCRMAVLNRVLCIVEYQADGWTKNIYRQYVSSPRGFAWLRKQRMKLPSGSILRACMECVHYVSSSLISRNRHFLRESPRKVLTALAVPFGIIWTIYVRRKAGK